MIYKHANSTFQYLGVYNVMCNFGLVVKNFPNMILAYVFFYPVMNIIQKVGGFKIVLKLSCKNVIRSTFIICIINNTITFQSVLLT